MIRMAIADSNERYLERLLNVLEEYEDLNISVYTDRHSLEKALVSKNFDVLLFDPSMYEGQVALRKSTLAVMLLDESKEVPESLRDCAKVNRYQRISIIYQQILERYADISQDSSGILGGRKVTSIAFYSPVGGAGKTTLSLTAAAKLAMRGYKTLYVNLEETASDGCYLPQNRDKGISELLLSLGDNISFRMKIQGLLQSKSDNLFYMNHFSSPNDIYEITPEEISELLEQLAKSGLFEYIVVDMGVYMDKRALRVFDTAQRIVLVEKPDTISMDKMQCFLAQRHIIGEYGRKMTRVLNFDNGRAQAVDTEIPRIGQVGIVQNPDSGQVIGMLSNNSGVSFVNALV